MKWLDQNGATLRVGDTVRFGESVGEVLILEDWPAIGGCPREAGVYVSHIGHWGDCRAVPASRVVKTADQPL